MCKQGNQSQDKYQYQLFLRLDNGEKHLVRNLDKTPRIYNDQAAAIAEAGHIAGHCPNQVGLQATISFSLDLSSIAPQAKAEVMN